jgi:hypothetical protein
MTVEEFAADPEGQRLVQEILDRKEAAGERPLTLTVYPTWDDGFGNLYADKDNRQYPTRVDFEVLRKRLTDAELAAEYWAARSSAANRRHAVDMGATNFPGMSADEAEDLEKVMHRFATHPHHDQEGR